MTQALLCIGGPLDGQLQAYNGQIVKVSIDAGDIVTYRRGSIAGEKDRIDVFVLDGMSSDEVFRRLIDNYAPQT